ncbi:MAG: phosphotransferase, partial [Clostridiales bacterium]|nr:phosphotransferase [Clostridiales bacterium]
MEKAIYVITGVMASGKSTVTEILARSLDKCVHLRGDVFRKMI